MKGERDLFRKTPPASGLDRLWAEGPDVILGVMHGALPTKSNQRRIVMVGPKFAKRPLVIKSDAARAYEEKFETAVWRSLRDLHAFPEEARLYLRATVYQENLRRDLDCEILPDLLQKFKVIKNDRAVWVKEYRREIDRERPRVEFEIGVLSETERGNRGLD